MFFTFLQFTEYPIIQDEPREEILQINKQTALLENLRNDACLNSHDTLHTGGKRKRGTGEWMLSRKKK